MGGDTSLLFRPTVIDELDFDKEVYYILYNYYTKKFMMVKIYCEQFDQGILLLVKIYTINAQIKNYMRAVWS
jgi:hypothetical protein